MLEARNISHKFDYPLFEGVNLTLLPHQSLSIVGVSGCGKSTLLHICASLLMPNSGEVFYNNNSIYKTKNSFKREDFGIIFQSHYLFKGFSALENIELATIIANQSINSELNDKLGISHILDQNIGSLSGGQQQRVSIARVLSKKPKIIFADEPTGNLDSKTANEAMNVLFDYIKTNNASLFLVTHDNDLAKKCDLQYELKNQNLRSI